MRRFRLARRGGAADVSASDTPRGVPLRHVAAVFIGNGLEFYDFLTFSYFSVYIARTFFPQDSPNAALLATLATFGAGFLTRPIGAIIIGRMGDRVGRKPALLVSFSLMGVAIAGLALTPSYSVIGYAGPALVLLFRLLQGFALGGEVGPSTAYMAEAAPPGRRGLYLSMQYVTQDGAVLVAGLIGVLLAHFLSDQQLQEWGWRVAMLLGACIVPFGLALRRSLPETLDKARAAASQWASIEPHRSPWQRLRPFLPLTILGLMMLTAGTIGSYTINYMTTYALDTLKLSATLAFGLTVVNGATNMVFEATSGILSDRFGRKPVMILFGTLLTLSIIPGFWIIDHFRNAAALYGAEFVMAALASLAAVPVIVTVTEQLPPAIRSGALATIYAFAISIFGGSTQFMIKWMLVVTGNPLAPAWYWTGAAIIGLIAMCLIKESAPRRLRMR